MSAFATAVSGPLSPSAVTLLPDIAYLPPDRAEKLDAYLPPAAIFPGPHPAVLLIHGGGWRICDKADGRERNIAQSLAACGYAVFSINYLLNVGEHDPATGQLKLTRLAWPQNLIDCKSSLRFLRAEAARFNIDPARIAAMGGSAGAHLAMLVGAMARSGHPAAAALASRGDYADQPAHVSCIINLYGDADIRGRRVSPFAGATPEETAANEEAASPVTYFDKNTPPMLIAHGTADTIIPVERSRLLARILEEKGLDYWYVEIAGAPHTFDLQPAQMDLRPVVLAFLEKHLGKPAPRSR
ncbi:alpha/beta hydrolase fold protein [Opitutaceae bacterium TAV1]|nr:alpha/beta hydrolase fold protein [Opitutaceae bacterium TAV1]